MFVQQSSKPSQPSLFTEDAEQDTEWKKRGDSIGLGSGGKRQLREHDWIAGLFCMVCDIVCWVALYGLVSYLRREAFYTSAFEFVLVDVITVAVLLQSLFIIGGLQSKY